MGWGHGSGAHDSKMAPWAFPPMTASGHNSKCGISKSLYLPPLLLFKGSVWGLRLGENVLFKTTPQDCWNDCVRKLLEMRMEKTFLFTLPWVRETVTITQIIPGRFNITFFFFQRPFIFKISLISGLFPHWPLPIGSVIWMESTLRPGTLREEQLLFANVDHRTEYKAVED